MEEHTAICHKAQPACCAAKAPAHIASVAEGEAHSIASSWARCLACCSHKTQHAKSNPPQFMKQGCWTLQSASAARPLHNTSASAVRCSEGFWYVPVQICHTPLDEGKAADVVLKDKYIVPIVHVTDDLTLPEREAAHVTLAQLLSSCCENNDTRALADRIVEVRHR